MDINISLQMSSYYIRMQMLELFAVVECFIDQSNEVPGLLYNGSKNAPVISN